MPEIDGFCLRFYSRWLARRDLASIGFGFNLKDAENAAATCTKFHKKNISQYLSLSLSSLS